MLDSTLPCYSPSIPAPPYSLEPSCGEQRLGQTLRSGRSRLPLTSTIIKKQGKITAVLDGQEVGADTPSYGRQAVIRGTLCFNDSEKNSHVAIKIQGRLEATISEGGSKTIQLVNDTYTLWKSETAGGSTCPAQIAFACQLPSHFRDGREERPLPPSFHTFVPGFYIHSQYKILVEVIRVRHRVGLWPTTKKLVILFNYFPRTRPSGPIMDIPCFLSSIKTLPEEWYQSTSILKTSRKGSFEPLYCHLFIPSVRVYSLTDNIPFHIQLNGPLTSLREFFPPTSLDRITSAGSSLSSAQSESLVAPDPKSCVRIQLLRQAVVQMRGQKVWRNSEIGNGVAYPLPPPVVYESTDRREECLDWTGHVRCNDGVAVGGLHTDLVQVKDFISLTLIPPDLRTSAFPELRITVPVRIVSDAYTDFGTT
ncbi:hypothetical protein AMATHDRAFT_137845 [Amanita thiersii Skay4041]|uniref:Arrestin-like N-terminal domain-containing protein n=1 Tax=Amanita thiersii Skay4041 TaxID=703135 RepID=A0A2A9NY33_9AGAR|nr:hypothetical protein AMATHDRAFT_137845 [Amanita thiersii Skay4041]